MKCTRYTRNRVCIHYYLVSGILITWSFSTITLRASYVTGEILPVSTPACDCSATSWCSGIVALNPLIRLYSWVIVPPCRWTFSLTLVTSYPATYHVILRLHLSISSIIFEHNNVARHADGLTDITCLGSQMRQSADTKPSKIYGCRLT